jgi:hypothetical protein
MHYRIRIKGELDPSWQVWLDQLQISHGPSGTTVLAGYLPDQAALDGVLLTLRRLGLTLLSVETSETKQDQEQAEPGEHHPRTITCKNERRFPMNVLMVHSKVKAAYVAEVDAAAKRMFAALELAQPQGIRYTSCRLPDGVTYVSLLEIDDGVDNPLPTLPEFRAFQEGLKQWIAEPPTSEQLAVVGSYRFF